jgi:DNA-binding Lrp family transcriptional regulator
MVELDEQEVKIIRELIRNPRISDNQISKNTRVPVMSVNRKRKNLEEKGLISYYADFKHGENGSEDFHVKQLYIVKCKIGLTKKEFLTKIRNDKTLRKFNSEYVVESHVGEKDGHLAILTVLNAKNQSELTESFNGKIFPMLKNNFGNDCIVSTDTVTISETIREHHNYIHKVNIVKGVLDKGWPNEYLFVDRKSFHSNSQEKIDKHYKF